MTGRDAGQPPGMDASWTLWVIIAVVVLLVVAGGLALGRRSARANVPKPHAPNEGYAVKRPGLPGEPD